MDNLQEVEKIIQRLSEIEPFSENGKDLWNELDKLYDEQPDGLFLGKLIKEQVADGYAMYVIDEIHNNFVYITHIEQYVDGYQVAPYWKGGSFRKTAIAKQIKAQDDWRKMLNNLK